RRRVGRLQREAGIGLGAQIGYLSRQLVAAGRRLTKPEGDRRRRTVRITNAHGSGHDLRDLPRGVAQLKDVARHALDGEVLVERADERLLRLEDDAVVGHFWNRTARGQRQEPRPTSRTKLAIHFISMDERGSTAAR